MKSALFVAVIAAPTVACGDEVESPDRDSLESAPDLYGKVVIEGVSADLPRLS